MNVIIEEGDTLELSLTRGDGIAGLAALPAQSVDLLFADLPSGQTQAPFDRPIDLDAFWAAVRHAARPTTPIVLMASNMRYAVAVVTSNPQEFRYDLVWRKNRASGHLNANRQPLRAHEFLLVFYKKAPAYTPQKSSGHKPVNPFYTRESGQNYGAAVEVRSGGGSTERYPTSVLDFDVVSNVGEERSHPQQKPDALLCWVVSSFTKPGQLVADPCAGSGAMGYAATSLDRRFVGWEEIDPALISK